MACNSSGIPGEFGHFIFSFLCCNPEELRQGNAPRDHTWSGRTLHHLRPAGGQAYKPLLGINALLKTLLVSFMENKITQSLNWFVRMTSQLESNIVAVERTNEYSDGRTIGAEVRTASGEI